MIIGKLLPYNYKLKLEKLWNEVSLDWMFENGCLIYEVNYQLIALIYNQYSYFSSAELFVSPYKIILSLYGCSSTISFTFSKKVLSFKYAP